MLSQYALIIRGPVTKVQFGDFFFALFCLRMNLFGLLVRFFCIYCVHKGGVV